MSDFPEEEIPRVPTNSVEEIIYANSKADSNVGSERIALTDSLPLRQMIERTGQSNASAYEWHITKLPEDQILKAHTVRERALALFQDVCISRAHVDRRNWSDAQHREAVLRGNDVYEQLAKTHPRMVLMLTSQSCDMRKLQHLLELIELRAKQERDGKSTEHHQAEVSQYFRANFVREAKPGEEEEAVRNGTGMRGTMVTADDMAREQAARDQTTLARRQ